MTEENQVFSPNTRDNSREQVCKNEHLNVQILPAEGILWTYLRSFENELRTRNSLPQQLTATCNPLWFWAETEINVYLWRNGKSIADRAAFEFWIKVPELIEKRLRHLENPDRENPLVNHFWGLQYASSDLIASEREYLLELDALYRQVSDHLFAISKVQRMLAEELFEGASVPIVVLPSVQLSKS